MVFARNIPLAALSKPDERADNFARAQYAPSVRVAQAGAEGCESGQEKRDDGNMSVLSARFRHELGGVTVSVTPHTIACFGKEHDELLGNGFLCCVHIQDRPIFLKALSDAFHDDTAIKTRFRIRVGKAETGMPEAGLLLVEGLFWPEGNGPIVKSSIRVIRKASERDEGNVNSCAGSAEDDNRQRLLGLAQGELLDLASAFSVLCQSAVGGADDDIARLQTLRYLSERLVNVGDLLCNVGAGGVSSEADTGISSLLGMVKAAIALQDEKALAKKLAISVDVAAAVREPVAKSFRPLIEMLLSCAARAVLPSGTIDITTRREGRAATISLILSPVLCPTDDAGSFLLDLAIVRNLAIRRGAQFSVSHRLVPSQQWVLRLPLVVKNNSADGDGRSIYPAVSRSSDGNITFTKQDKSVA